MNNLNYFWSADGAWRGMPVRDDEDRAVMRVLDLVGHSLTGYQCADLERALRQELRKRAKSASYNPSLDWALNSGDGVYRP